MIISDYTQKNISLNLIVLNINNSKLEPKHKRNVQRMSMLTKLRYVGVTIEDLIDIYVLFIRSVTEYCATAFHSSLTVEQATDIERIQKTSLKIILGDSYVSYEAALEMTGLQTLHDRREKRCLDFA